MGKTIGLILVLVVLAVQFRGEVRLALGLPEQVPATALTAVGSRSGAVRQDLKLVMYSRPSCGDCDRARRYFSRHNVSVEERDVSREITHEHQWRSLGGRSVPLFLVNGEVVHGWNRQRMESRIRR